MSIPVTAETGTTLTLAWAPERVSAEVGNLREDRGNIRAEVTFFTELENGEIVQLLMRRISLVEDGDRWRICKALAERMDRVNWADILEQACTLAVRWFRKGEPIVTLVDVEAPATLSYLVDRIIPEDATTIVFGDGGCVSGDTIIDGVGRADELVGKGPIEVWAMGPEGMVRVWSPGVYLKGSAPLLCITVDGGDIKVAPHHRFMTPKGWVYASDLAVGEQLAVSVPFLPGSNWEPSPSTQTEDDPHSMQTLLGSIGCCSPGSRHGDGPLHVERVGGLLLAQQPGDARERILRLWHSDVPNSSGEYSHAYRLTDRHARTSYALAELSEQGAGSVRASSRATRHFENSQVRLLSQQEMHFAMPSPSLAQSAKAKADARFSCFNPSFTTILSIRKVGYAQFYDLHVPLYENYLANGFVNHNTGKSMFALYTAVAVASGVSLPHNLRPSRPGNVLYLDWEETDPGEHRRRLRRIAQGLGVPEPRGIYYRPCFRPLVEDVELLEVEVRKLDISLVIADSLMPACGGDPADSMAAIQTMNALRRLGATRLAIGHITQAARQGPAPLQTTFGSVVWRNLARAQWQLVSDDDQPDDSSNRFALYQRKTNNDRRDRWPIGLRYDFVEDGGPITMHADDVHATDGLAVGASITERIRRALAEGGLKGTEELGELVDRTPDQVRGILTKMRDVVNINAGQTGKGHKGLYGLKAHGESPAQQFRCFKCGDQWAELYDEQEGRPCCARHQSASA